MPTTRRRHIITETDEVSRALDAAAKHWPEDRDSRAKLVVRLLGEGYRALSEAADETAEQRKEALRRTSGLLTGAYGPRYLESLRQDWPE